MSSSCWFLAIVVILHSSYVSPAQIEIKRFLECSEPVENDAVTVTFKNDPPRADVVLDSQYDISGSDIVELVAHKYVEDHWEKRIIETEDTVDKYIENFLSVAWEKIRDACDTKFSGTDLPKGKYTWTDLQVSADDVNQPGGLDGLIQVEATLYSGDTPVFCIAAEANVDLLDV